MEVVHCECGYCCREHGYVFDNSETYQGTAGKEHFETKYLDPRKKTPDNLEELIAIFDARYALRSPSSSSKSASSSK